MQDGIETRSIEDVIVGVNVGDVGEVGCLGSLVL